MFCSKCGKKINSNAQFCQNCGFALLNQTIDKTTNTSGQDNYLNIPEILFYSQEWHQINVIAVSSIPHFDILITKKGCSLIKFPSTHWGTIGFLIGLMFATIIGAAIGYNIGNSSDTKTRKTLRATWLGLDDKLISQYYEKNVFLKIPLEKIKNGFNFPNDKSIVITYNNIKIKLKRNNKLEAMRLRKYINNFNI